MLGKFIIETKDCPGVMRMYDIFDKEQVDGFIRKWTRTRPDRVAKVWNRLAYSCIGIGISVDKYVLSTAMESKGKYILEIGMYNWEYEEGCSPIAWAYVDRTCENPKSWYVDHRLEYYWREEGFYVGYGFLPAGIVVNED